MENSGNEGKERRGEKKREKEWRAEEREERREEKEKPDSAFEALKRLVTFPIFITNSTIQFQSDENKTQGLKHSSAGK